MRQLGDAGAIAVKRAVSAERDDHSTGRPLVYRPTPRLLQLLGTETLEEAQGRMGVPAGYGSPGEALAHGTTADGVELAAR